MHRPLQLLARARAKGINVCACMHASCTSTVLATFACTCMHECDREREREREREAGRQAGRQETAASNITDKKMADGPTRMCCEAQRQECRLIEGEVQCHQLGHRTPVTGSHQKVATGRKTVFDTQLAPAPAPAPAPMGNPHPRFGTGWLLHTPACKVSLKHRSQSTHQGHIIILRCEAIRMPGLPVTMQGHVQQCMWRC